MDRDIKTQKFGIGRILREGWRLYRGNFIAILAVGLCVYVPINVILALVSVYFPGANPGQPSNIVNFIGLMLQTYVGGLATMAIAYVVEQAVREKPTTWGEALRHARSRWGSYIGTSLAAGIILLGLTLLLIIPGIIWGVYYTFYAYVVALRNVGGMEALRYSRGLVQGQWWRVFAIRLCIIILAFMVGFAGRLIFAVPFALMSSSSNSPLEVFGLYTMVDMLQLAFVVFMVVFFLNSDYLRNPPRSKIAS